MEIKTKTIKFIIFVWEKIDMVQSIFNVIMLHSATLVHTTTHTHTYVAETIKQHVIFINFQPQNRAQNTVNVIRSREHSKAPKVTIFKVRCRK